jgi:UDP:flavonoid glycosyltransferase YjiC (YdhE family)
VLRALTSGCAVVVVPAGGDMGENAARLDWAGLGVRLPQRLLSPATIRLAVERALADGALRERVRGVAAWAARSDGTVRAAEAVEALAGQPAERVTAPSDRAM